MKYIAVCRFPSGWWITQVLEWDHEGDEAELRIGKYLKGPFTTFEEAESSVGSRVLKTLDMGLLNFTLRPNEIWTVYDGK